MEKTVDAAMSGSRELKACRRNRRRSEKKTVRRIELEKSYKEEDERSMDEEEFELCEWLSSCRYWSNHLTLRFGSCEDDITSVPPMRYTKVMPAYAITDHALQIFSVQMMELKDDLEWPLHVYGWVASRDSVDYKRNLLFNRTRDNCQVLTQQDSYLQLTGPSRAVVLIDPVTFQIELKVKGETESEDKILSLKVFEYNMPIYPEDKPYLIRTCCPGKRTTIEVTYAEFYETVEATVVSVQVIDGSWPDHLRGLVVCRTTSLDKEDILLLDSRDGGMPITCDGAIELSRRVVSVDVRGQLSVDVVASQIDDKSDVVAKDTVVFGYSVAGSNRGRCDLGFCKVEITVAWSLLAILSDMMGPQY